MSFRKYDLSSTLTSGFSFLSHTNNSRKYARYSATSLGPCIYSQWQRKSRNQKKKLQISTKVCCRLAQISTKVCCRLTLCNIGCSMTRNPNKLVSRTKNKRAKIFNRRHQRCSLMKSPTVYTGAVQVVTARDSWFCKGVLHIQWTGHVPISVSKRMTLELHEPWSDRSGPCLVFRWDGYRFTVCLRLFAYPSFFARPTGNPSESRTFIKTS